MTQAVANRVFYAYGTLVLLCIAVAIATETYWLAGAPILIWVLAQAILDFRPFYWFLLFLIPIGIEVQLPGGFGTDLPTEPIAVGLTALILVHALTRPERYAGRGFGHPIAWLVYVHLAWIIVATCFSSIPFQSLKFTLAKGWYLGSFFAATLLIIRTPKDVHRLAHVIFWPLLFVAVQTLVRHGLHGFSFADQFRTMSPFMRNHVAYAGCMAAFTPWLAYLLYYRRRRGRPNRLYWLLLVPIWFLAIYFSFTRAAYVAIILAGATYYIIRWRLIGPALVLATLIALGTATFLVRDNKYLDYAPNFDTTISHDEFGNLISATYKFEDISTMERFYRWVAGGHMIPYRPVTGWGPSTFYDNYRGYAINNFETYVSDNPEKSGIHNYFLLILVEQGYPGLLLFLVFLFGTFLIGQRAYHRQPDPERRAVIACAVCSLVVITAFSLINDVIETDKMGSLFWIAVALIVAMDLKRTTN